MAEHAAAAIENARLIQAKQQAERLAALGTASASLAHYIKNVLMQWNGSATLIDMGLEQNKPEMIEQIWPVMKRATGKVSKLVQDMLVISKEREPERQPVELNKMIEEILEDSRAQADKAEVELASDLDAALPAAQLDPTRIHDSILNIVGNAIDALGDIGARDGRVTVTSRFDAEKELITVSIQDNGPGIPPDKIERIFEPFYSTKGSRGTGLGLAVVRKTIEEHGGRLRLDSTVGEGSTFTVELPFLAVE